MSRGSEKVIRYRKRIKTKMIKAMGGECQSCGYNKCEDALEFHHIDPKKKKYGFGQLRSNPREINVLIEELKKCVMLCCICHREFHAGIRKLPSKYKKLDESIMRTE